MALDDASYAAALVVLGTIYSIIEERLILYWQKKKEERDIY
jgi:hypothetical protein